MKEKPGQKEIEESMIKIKRGEARTAEGGQRKKGGGPNQEHGSHKSISTWTPFKTSKEIRAKKTHVKGGLYLKKGAVMSSSKKNETKNTVRSVGGFSPKTKTGISVKNKGESAKKGGKKQTLGGGRGAEKRKRTFETNDAPPKRKNFFGQRSRRRMGTGKKVKSAITGEGA